MREYVIRVSESEFSELVKNIVKVINESGLEYKVDSGITCGCFIRFQAKKKQYKNLKKRLSLKIKSIYLEMDYGFIK